MEGGQKYKIGRAMKIDINWMLLEELSNTESNRCEYSEDEVEAHNLRDSSSSRTQVNS